MYSAEIMKMSPKYPQRSQRQVVGSWHLMMQVSFSRPRNSTRKVWNRNPFQAVPGHTPPQKKNKTTTVFCLNPKCFQRITTISKIQVHCGWGEDKNSCRMLKNICSVFGFVVAKEEGVGVEGRGRTENFPVRRWTTVYMATSYSRAQRTLFTIVW